MEFTVGVERITLKIFRNVVMNYTRSVSDCVRIMQAIVAFWNEALKVASHMFM